MILEPLVSVIMPAYNAERYIADSIRSVIDQTYQSWELVVVDDGSRDKTAEIVQPLAAADSRVKYIFQENGRQGKARNTGVANSKGTLIAFLDSDDLWVRQTLELQVKAVHTYDVDVVFSECFIFLDDNVADETQIFSIPCGRFEGQEWFNTLLIQNRLPVLTTLVRRRALEKVGLFEEEGPFQGSEDYDLWLRLAKEGMAFFGINQPLARYRRHAQSMTHQNSGWLKPTLMVVSRHIEDGSLGRGEKKRRLRNLYRELIAALLEEGELAEAKEYMKEFSAWDRAGVVTSIQKVLMKAWPGGFNLVSRECLYRTEWHLRSLMEKTQPAQDKVLGGMRCL